MKRFDRPRFEALARLLRQHLAAGGESTLADAYELARRALGDGLGVLDMAVLLSRAVRSLPPGERPEPQRIESFLLECLSPFELAHRGAREAGNALRALGERREAHMREVAHALHDEAGQLLAAVHLALEELRPHLVAGGEPLLERATQLLVRTEDEIRRLARELRPLVLDDLGLVPALRQLAEGVAHRTGLQVSVAEGFRNRLPRAIELSLYRAAQEALSNVLRHAGARHVRLELEQAGDVIELRIRDDGRGFDTKRIGTGRRTHGLGLRGMQERAQALGGRLEVSSQPGNGSEIRMTLPLEGSHVQNGADPHPARG